MNVGDLFIKLGLKGDDEAVKGTEKVDKGLKGIVTTGFAVKAGLAAMAYGLQKLMFKSSAAGASLNKFHHATGLSAEMLQRWQYAGRQFNVSADEVAGSIVGIQDSVTNMIADGSQVPKGWAMMAAETNLDHGRIRDAFYVAKKIQQFAQMGHADMARMLSKSLGMSDGMFAAMRQNAFNQKLMSKAPIFSGKEVSSLQKVNVGWENLFDKFDKGMGRMNAKFGPGLITNITKLADAMFKIGDGLGKLAEKFKVFEAVASFFGMAGLGVDLISGDEKTTKEASKFGNTLLGNMKEMFSKEDFFAGDDKQPWEKRTQKDHTKIWDRSSSGKLGSTKTSNSEVTINQNLNFQHEGKDAQKTGASVKESITKAFRNSPTQAQEQ